MASMTPLMWARASGVSPWATGWSRVSRRQRIWQWKDQYEARILGQLKQLGVGDRLGLGVDVDVADAAGVDQHRQVVGVEPLEHDVRRRRPAAAPARTADSR